MNLVKFDIEVLEFYSLPQLMETKDNLNIALDSCRQLKNIYMDRRDTEKAVIEETKILRICENLDTLETVLGNREKEVMVSTNHGTYSLN